MKASTHSFAAADGLRLAWHEMGKGRPVVLLHGLFSNAFTNWIRFGHAEKIAAAGLRVVMPDLRAHGQSAAPHDPACYPRDVLVADGLALIEHLGLTDYDLGGYSLGARTAARMVVKGAAPRRLVIAGMGLTGMVATGQRAEHFKRILENLGHHERGTPEWNAEAFLKTTKADPKALLPLLDTFVATPEAELDRIAMPTLVVAGEEDHDNGSAEALAERLPNGRYAAVPGGHMSSVTKAELGEVMAEFLGS